jgi:molybdopterin-guanine dinucleotide biosynthesis protein A
MHTISAGILAGGEGRRHGGADKGWLPYRGRPLIEHVVDALRPQVDEVLVSANRNLERYETLGLRVVRDAERAGPLAGVCRLLIVARHPWLLCVPCDAPQLPADLAQRFADAAARARADVVVLHDGEYAHPTFCYLRSSLAGSAARFLASGRSSLMAWQKEQTLAWLHDDTPPLNLNTPQDLAQAEALAC